MGKRKKNKLIRDVFEECVSANECTGLLQKISTDPEEIKKFHEQFNKD